MMTIYSIRKNTQYFKFRHGKIPVDVAHIRSLETVNVYIPEGYTNEEMLSLEAFVSGVEVIWVKR